MVSLFNSRRGPRWFCEVLPQKRHLQEVHERCKIRQTGKPFLPAERAFEYSGGEMACAGAAVFHYEGDARGRYLEGLRRVLKRLWSTNWRQSAHCMVDGFRRRKGVQRFKRVESGCRTTQWMAIRDFRAWPSRGRRTTPGRGRTFARETWRCADFWICIRCELPTSLYAEFLPVKHPEKMDVVLFREKREVHGIEGKSGRRKPTRTPAEFLKAR